MIQQYTPGTRVRWNHTYLVRMEAEAGAVAWREVGTVTRHPTGNGVVYVQWPDTQFDIAVLADTIMPIAMPPEAGGAT